MFHTILTLAYLIPGTYLFIRIWQLFINRKHLFTYLSVFALLFLVYPLGNTLKEGSASAKVLESASNYLLPFFLYLFLLVLLADIILLLNLVFRFIPGEKSKLRPLPLKLLAFIIGLSVTVVIGGVINFNTIRTSEYSISVPGGRSDLKKLRIAFVSDFHLQEDVPVRYVKRFAELIGGINPDLMLFGGDIVEGDPDDGRLEQFEEILSGIKVRFGSYGVLGNHEHYSRQDQGDFFVRSGIEILRDTVIVKGSSFAIAGRNDSHIQSRFNADDLMINGPDTLPLILIDHRPTELEEISTTTADIVFSGHTHHGQLFPINLITGRVYELSWGYLQKNKTHFFVSSGIRLWGFPVRTTGKSEILVTDITLE